MRKTVDTCLPPSSLAKIEKLLNEAGLIAPTDSVAGELARTLAVSKPGGVFLQIGEGSPLLSAWLLDGMDITSRLITVVGAGELIGIAKRTIGEDIRVAVHAQDVLGFFEDIRAHQFHMIVFDRWPAERVIVEAAVSRLATGGLMLILCPGRSGPQERALSALGEDERVRFVRVIGAGEAVLAVRRPATMRSVRRIGRRRRSSQTTNAVR